VALSLFWPASLAAQVPPPSGMIVLEDPVHTWAEVIRQCRLPAGFIGLLVAVEVAAYTSTLSALINWGGSFVINDLYRPLDPAATVRREVWVSRVTTLLLFIAASVVAILYVKQMVGWFMFINSAMVIFLLPLAVFRFFWWRFNVWGELAAIVLGLPLSIFVWFVLDFQNTEAHPMWHGLGLLFVLSFVVLTAVTLLTPAESPETLKRFYQRCRPPGFWGPVRASMNVSELEVPSTRKLLLNSALGVLTCFCLVMATNAVFVSTWSTTAVYIVLTIVFSAVLVVRVLKNPSVPAPSAAECSTANTVCSPVN
jgi:Na+/proline symporter